MKHAIVELSTQELARLLGLPAGVVVTQVDMPIDRVEVVRVRVLGAGWDLPDRGAVPMFKLGEGALKV